MSYLDDNELPGMWEHADLIGGATDVEPPETFEKARAEIEALRQAFDNLRVGLTREIARTWDLSTAAAESGSQQSAITLAGASGGYLAARRMVNEADPRIGVPVDFPGRLTSGPVAAPAKETVAPVEMADGLVAARAEVERLRHVTARDLRDEVVERLRSLVGRAIDAGVRNDGDEIAKILREAGLA